MRRPLLRGRLRIGWELARATVRGFVVDRGGLLSAALAFYMLLSLAPLFIVATAVAALVLDPADARGELTRIVEQSIGPGPAAEINTWVDRAAESGAVASITGLALALFSASRFFGKLRAALNHIFGIDAYLEAGFRATVHGYLRRRLLAFAMVLGGGIALLAASVSRTFLTAVHEKLFGGSSVAAITAQITHVSVTIVLVGLVTAAVLRLVPDARLGWRAIVGGAALTSILFNAVNVLFGIYLSHATVAAPYAAAGTMLVVLLWINVSAQSLLLGAELAHVLATRSGRRYPRRMKHAKRSVPRTTGEGVEAFVW
jgi:membrane protein